MYSSSSGLNPTWRQRREKCERHWRSENPTIKEDMTRWGTPVLILGKMTFELTRLLFKGRVRVLVFSLTFPLSHIRSLFSLFLSSYSICHHFNGERHMPLVSQVATPLVRDIHPRRDNNLFSRDKQCSADSYGIHEGEEKTVQL